MKISKTQIKEIKNLALVLIDDGSNVEYTRGICELIADFDGKEEMPHDMRTAEIAQEFAKRLGVKIKLDINE